MNRRNQHTSNAVSRWEDVASKIDEDGLPIISRISIPKFLALAILETGDRNLYLD